VISGAYVSAFALVVTGRYGRKVVNPSPQTRRLEHGFIGVDSLGRHYYQPAFPHFGPASVEVRPKFVDAMTKVPVEAWRATK
jgi:hypothetical protein